MKFKTGDKVKFLHDKGHGVVSSVIDKKTVMVRTEDGFDIPFIESDLVLYGKEENLKMSGKEENIEETSEINEEQYEPEEPEQPIEDEEIVFAANLSRSGTDIVSHLVNSSSYNLYYTVSRTIAGEEHLLARGILEADTKVRLVKLVPANMSEEWEIKVNLLFWNNGFFNYVRPVHRSINLEFNGLYSGTLLTENDYFDQKSAIFTVHSFKASESFENKRVENDLKAALQEKEKKEEKKKAKKAVREPEMEEVDLHIETIVDDHKGLSNGEILDIQLSRFKTKLETAIIHKTRRIVFIHGIGNGKLKHEIRKTLDRKYPDLKYQDASFKEYGYGATMVIIPG